MYPTLMVSQNLTELLEDFYTKGALIFSVDPVENLRPLWESWKDYPPSRLVVLGDISDVPEHRDLLRIAEIPDLKLVLLASRDNIPPPLLQRVMRFMKNPTVIQHEEDDPRAILETTGEEDLSRVVRLCPSMAEILYLHRRKGSFLGRKFLELCVPEKGTS